MSSVPSFPVWRGGSKDRRAEVVLLAQMGIGQGDNLVMGAKDRQSQHHLFVDALDEPSAKVLGTDHEVRETTALYTFVVGSSGHPFHCHAGHRVFTAVSGSGGTSIRFSFASEEDIHQDELSFLRQASCIEIPPDCLFSVRFGSGVWHQFLPGSKGHPALFALSCHTEETSETARSGLSDDQASIASLTKTLPPHMDHLLTKSAWASVSVSLSLGAPPDSLSSRMCRFVRGCVGPLLNKIPRGNKSFAAHKAQGEYVLVANDTMVLSQLPKSSHIDAYAVSLNDTHHPALLMQMLLQGFVNAPPKGAARWMMLRNIASRPFKLRTSPLCCPVSSLLSNECPAEFRGYPVLASEQTPTRCRVLLGADDWHLSFRTEIDVSLENDKTVITMTTGVQPSGHFGAVYLWIIKPVHRRKITPDLLNSAIAHVKGLPAHTHQVKGIIKVQGV